MEKQSEIMAQYGKIHTLYKTIIYLQKEIKKETDKVKKLEKEEKHAHNAPQENERSIRNG